MNNQIKKFLKEHYKNGLIFALIINILLIALMIVTYVLTKSNLYFIPFIFVIVLFNGFIFYRNLSSYGESLNKLINEFTYLFKFVYLDINNDVKVMTSLLSLKEKSGLKMNELLLDFISNVKNDSTLKPYLEFAEHFSSILVEETLINLYRYQKDKSKQNLDAFNQSYLKLKRVVESNQEKKNETLFDLIKSTAIIGASIVVIIVIISAVIIIEEYIHG